MPDAPTVPTGHLFDACAICTLVNLANPVAPAPVLPLPEVHSRTRFHVDIERRFAASPHRLFQARAPPLA